MFLNLPKKNVEKYLEYRAHIDKAYADRQAALQLHPDLGNTMWLTKTPIGYMAFGYDAEYMSEMLKMEPIKYRNESGVTMCVLIIPENQLIPSRMKIRSFHEAVVYHDPTDEDNLVTVVRP